MVFIRTKKSKGNEYATLVESKYDPYTQEKAERVIKNLGRVYQFSSLDEHSFSSFVTQTKQESIVSYIQETSYATLLNDVIHFFLIRYGFQKKETFEASIDTHNKKNLQKQLKKIPSGAFVHFVQHPKKPFCIVVEREHKRVYESRFFRECTLRIPPGYLNSFTLQELFSLQLSIHPSYDADSQIKRIFIQKFIRCGFVIEQNALLLIYQRFLHALQKEKKGVSYVLPESTYSTPEDEEVYTTKKDFMDEFL
jgi:hypothetical protein